MNQANNYIKQPPNYLEQALQLFRQALVGGNYDYTTGSIRRAVILLAIPMVLEMGLESVFAVADMMFVSALGMDAIATVGLTEALLSLLYALAAGLGVAVTALVARRIGEKHTQAAITVASQTVWLGAVVGLIVGVVGVTYAADILEMMGAEPQVIAMGKDYMAVMLGGSVTIVYLFLFNAVYRGAGNASIAMRILAVSNLINLVLDPCLIFGLGPFPEMGVTGAAVATAIGRGCGVLFQAYYLLNGKAIIGLTLARLRFNARVMLSLLRLSVGGITQILVATVSWVVLTRLVAAYGSEAVAGYTVATRVTIFAILPALGLSNAASTLVGQNLGAAQPRRAELSVLTVMKYNLFLLALESVLLLSAAPAIIHLFSSQPEVVRYGVDCLRIFSVGLISFCMGMASLQCFNGAGDTTTPMRINFLCFWVLEIPLAYLLAEYAGMGPHGVFLAIPLAETVLAVIAYTQFRKGRWKLQQV